QADSESRRGGGERGKEDSLRHIGSHESRSGRPSCHKHSRRQLGSFSVPHFRRRSSDRFQYDECDKEHLPAVSFALRDAIRERAYDAVFVKVR
ncbi:hypothetical protein PMAYCL1PPCAC_27607, partial [Pristionchus mayeri]